MLNVHPLSLWLTNYRYLYTLGYVSSSKPLKSFPSYHIPANPALSWGYALFCATAAHYLFCSQWLAHSFHCDRGGTLLLKLGPSDIQNRYFVSFVFTTLQTRLTASSLFSHPCKTRGCHPKPILARRPLVTKMPAMSYLRINAVSVSAPLRFDRASGLSVASQPSCRAQESRARSDGVRTRTLVLRRVQVGGRRWLA